MIEERISPCPKCGLPDYGDNLIIPAYTNGAAYVECDYCKHRGPTLPGRKQAVTAWNRIHRPYDYDTPEEIAQLMRNGFKLDEEQRGEAFGRGLLKSIGPSLFRAAALAGVLSGNHSVYRPDNPHENCGAWAEEVSEMAKMFADAIDEDSEEVK